jgi:hypothetical protein
MNFLQKVKIKATGETGFVLKEAIGTDGEHIFNSVYVYVHGEIRAYKLDELEPCKPTIREFAQFLGAKWYSIDSDGEIYIHYWKPTKEARHWECPHNSLVDDNYIDCSELENVPWQDSLREV